MTTRLDIAPPFAAVDRHLARAIAAGGDTSEHLPLLRALVERINAPSVVVVEMGVRAVVSTWALLAGRPETLLSVDIAWPPAALLEEARRCAAEIGTSFGFVLSDTLTLKPIPCDFLFIDTLHTYAQLRAELARHAGKVAHYIALHDTETFGTRGEDGSEPGLLLAIHEFLESEEGRAWRVVHAVPECNGLIVLERVQ